MVLSLSKQGLRCVSLLEVQRSGVANDNLSLRTQIDVSLLTDAYTMRLYSTPRDFLRKFSGYSASVPCLTLPKFGDYSTVCAARSHREEANPNYV